MWHKVKFKVRFGSCTKITWTLSALPLLEMPQLMTSSLSERKIHTRGDGPLKLKIKVIQLALKGNVMSDRFTQRLNVHLKPSSLAGLGEHKISENLFSMESNPRVRMLTTVLPRNSSQSKIVLFNLVNFSVILQG